MDNLHIVSVSGGASSGATLIRIAERYPHHTIRAVFANTQWEHPDVYRFIKDLQDFVGIPITILEDGRTPSDVSEDQKMIFNSRVAKCTQELKVKPIRQYVKQLEQELQPNKVFIHIGYNMADRYERASTIKPYGRLTAPLINWALMGYYVKYPLWFYPRIEDPQKFIEDLGLDLPYLYKLRKQLNVPLSNNCSGGCFKQGVKHWYSLALLLPDVFKARMEWEEHMRSQEKYKNYAICTRSIKGVKTAYPLKDIWEDAYAGNMPKRLKEALMLDDIETDCVIECNPVVSMLAEDD